MTIARSYESRSGAQPCILLIQVNCLSMTALRKNIESAPGSLQECAPNLKRLWQEGVKFTRYYAAAAGAAPAHAAMMTGLYAYQTLFMHGHEDNAQNATARNSCRPPELSSDFPTYGKLLRAAGYDTPLLGSWSAFGAAKANVADAAEDDAVRMDAFGFSRPGAFAGNTAQWISQRLVRSSERPFCLSVSVATKMHGTSASRSDELAALDREVGAILNGIPAALSGNLIIVFTAARGSNPEDDADQEETLHVPLIVHDNSGRFVGDAGRPRDQLFSSVDLLPMLTSLAHLGSTEWLHESPAWHLLYARRGDLLACLLDADAPGRRQVVYTAEKLTQGSVDDTDPNRHVIGTVDGEGSACLCCCWRPGTTELVEPAQKCRTDVERKMEDCKRISPPEKVLRRLFDEVIPFDLQASMPVALEVAREAARVRLLDYLAQLDTRAAHGGSVKSGVDMR